jgi:iron complex outermembrane recepter protein
VTNGTFSNRRLLAGTALPFLSMLAFASPAAAQGSVNPPPNTPTNGQQASPNATQIDDTQSPAPVVNQNEQPGQDQTIVVTGTLFRSTTSATVSPITVITEQTLDQRGINTIQDAIQSLASNNGPALTNSFGPNGAFAGGASAVSLRGLSTSSTLVLFDGQRAAYYPLADDGTRNFVDLNTIPDDVVERIEVLRDGASSTYGADAIAGVVNIITRRSFNGVRARAEAGISQDGSNPTQRLSLTAGVGDLDTNGINAYVSGFYFHQGITYNSELPYPFNSSDKTGVCQGTDCGPNNVIGSRNPLTGAPRFATLIPYDSYVQAINPATNTVVPGARFQLLNPAAGCQYGPGYTLTAAELAANPAFPALNCTVDPLNEFGVVTPNIERFGGTVRVTARLADNAEGYFMANFQQSTVSYTGFPQPVRAGANTGILFPAFSTASGPSAALAPGSAELRLPVYVCPGGVPSAIGNNGCTAASPGAILNPNNPFAAQGFTARIYARPFLEPTFNETRSRVYRAAAGVSGTLWDNWNYRVDATAMHTDLNRHYENYLYINNLLTAIAQGTINLVNPQLNTQAQLDYVAPTLDTTAQSDLYAIQATLGTTLFQIGGRDVQFGFGGQIRYEGVNAPSANDDNNGPTQRYFTLNAFGTQGHRTVYGAFFELQVPILDILEVNASGRYDSYSSGQSHFSPKIGVKFTPIPEIALRATYSQGFRIPSFAEANALPTTGFVSTNSANFTNAFLNQYTIPGNNQGPGGTVLQCSTTTFGNANVCPAYVRTNSYGQTTLASPNLQPEESESFTLGAIFNPIHNFTVTVDYYDIKKTGAITQPSNAPALLAYYSCTAAQVNGGTCPIPAGYTVIPGAPDATGVYPGATPIIGFVQSQLVNSDTIRARGVDVAAVARFNFGHDMRFTSSLEASYILELSTTFPDGTKERYEGTLGNYNLTSGSGTPRVRGTWQNTLEWGPVTMTGTLNYVSGYNKSAEDQGSVAGDCTLRTGLYVTCDTPEYITADLTTQFRVNDNFTFYFNVINLLDELPPFDDRASYGNQYYNFVQGGNGIFGRQFRAGVRVNF